jgi:glycosyltransferase involved in cell wall biosynthesis
VVFASRGWLDDAVRYGLNRSSAHTIYFGVPMSAMTERPVSQGRLLWVGRMNPAKGLHHFVNAMPAIRSALPKAALMAIAKHEDDAYEAAILADVAGLQLGDALQIVPSVARADLQRAYADHDMLLCISPFSEPVPLVMMEAFTAGLPVIMSRPRAPSPLVLDGETCLCFDPDNPRTLVEAIVRLHGDSELRARITTNARKLVEDEFSLDRMGAKYDALLRRAATARPSTH